MILCPGVRPGGRGDRRSGDCLKSFYWVVVKAKGKPIGSTRRRAEAKANLLGGGFGVGLTELLISSYAPSDAGSCCNSLANSTVCYHRAWAGAAFADALPGNHHFVTAAERLLGKRILLGYAGAPSLAR